MAALFCDQATASTKKALVAKRWLGERLPRLTMLKELVCAGESSTLTDFEALAGPLPLAE